MVRALRQRELGQRREGNPYFVILFEKRTYFVHFTFHASGSSFISGSREFYYSLPIMRSKHCINRPQFHPMRFTPGILFLFSPPLFDINFVDSDGTKLIGLSIHLADVIIFHYSGVQSAFNCVGCG
jgi:hypothetical protein